MDAAATAAADNDDEDDDRFGRRGSGAAVDGDADETTVDAPGGLPSSDKGNDGLGAHESVSEVVGEVFSGYTCHSIEVRARSTRLRLLFCFVLFLKRSAHARERVGVNKKDETDDARFIRFIRAWNQ